MDKRYHSPRRHAWPLAGLLSAVAAMMFVAGPLQAAKKPGWPPTLSQFPVGHQQAIAEKMQLARFNEAFLAAVKARVEAAEHDAVFQARIREYPVGAKVGAFVQTLDRLDKQGVDTRKLQRQYFVQRRVLAKQAATGGISGTVTITGSTDGTENVEVVAFDIFGFPAGMAFASPGTGAYQIDGLAEGNYYVVTHSPFVDEFYNDVMLDFFTSWRNATLVGVVDGTVTAGIDFDLQRGALVSGTLTNAESAAPLRNRDADFWVFSETDPSGPIYRLGTVTDNAGAYEIIIPSTGRFKLAVMVSGFTPEFYDDESDFGSANVIEVTSLDQDIPGIDFALDPTAGPEGARIAGNVLGPGGNPVLFGFVFAFNAADTSVAGLGLTGFVGDYEITGLDAGDYILYADDYISFLLGQPGNRGEYFDNAQSSAEATVLSVIETTDTTGITFNLDPGGNIAGTITDDEATPLDSILVIAVKRFDIQNLTAFFPDHIDIGIGLSDADGRYTVSGLRDGNYVVRTVSLLSEKHAGRIVDEYYDNVQSIFDFMNATDVPVTAPATTEGIDFELQRGGAVAGHFYEVDGVTPIMGEGTVIAFNTATGKPEIAFSVFNSDDASYGLAPLPTGSFILLALASAETVIYLPQFYNGAATPEEATPVAVTAPAITAGIDFKMVRAGTIEGFVNLAAGFPTGADTLDVTVVAFDAATGVAAGGGESTFSGGYRIRGLAPGDYKVVALSAEDGYAATYFGGGTAFDDPNATPVTVTSDVALAKAGDGFTTAARADITLVEGRGNISGTVTDKDGEPVNGVLVLAYDQTGHGVSAGVSGFDLNEGTPLGPGQYRIEGLVSGSYFVRTFSLFQIFLLLERMDLAGLTGDGGDPFGLLLGLLAGAGGLLDEAEVELLADLWYPEVPAAALGEDFDLFGFLLGLLIGGVSEDGPPIPIPFFDRVPEGAQLVAVTSPGTTANIDFSLPELADIATAVDEPVAGVPASFQLFQNYPNPFNPSTVITYSVPNAAQVKLRIYNLLGQEIRALFDGPKPAGVHTIQWDGRNDRGEPVSGGIYFLSLIHI